MGQTGTRFAGDGMGMSDPMQIAGITVPGVLQRALEYGQRNIGNIYDATDEKLFRGRLPGGYPEPETFVEALDFGKDPLYRRPGNTNMPGVNPDSRKDDGFIGPISDEMMRRAIEREQLQRRQDQQRYDGPGYM